MTRDDGGDPLLAGVRVVDTTDAIGAACSAFLAELGAEVIRVEPPGGSAARRVAPTVDGESVAFAAHNAGKRGITLDLGLAVDAARFEALLGAADVWVTGDTAGEPTPGPFAPARVAERLPRLVVADVSEFGRTGPYAGRPATAWTHLAASGVLSRSGLPGRRPLMPPGDLVEPMTSVQVAWVLMVKLWDRLVTGRGGVIDASRFEAVLHIIDPPFSSTGTAALAQPGSPAARDRPAAVLYPIFRCADGYVRAVVLAPRQWHAMRAWLGEPEAFQDPRFDRNAERFAAADRLYPLIHALFARETADDLVAEGQRRGIPIAPVLSPAAVLSAPHYAERESFLDVAVGAGGRRGALASGYVVVDGVRARNGRAAPTVGEQGADETWTDRADAQSGTGDRPSEAGTRRPLHGIRVLDLGVIVMGGEAGRLLADQGADVIKVENRRFPDGVRAPGVNTSLAIGQRNKRSLGLDLRSPEGLALFDRLVAESDVVLTNFKPGTTDSLGIGYERLREINPAIVMTTCSAMGESGPWRDWMGYGPLVRCASGLTFLWDDPDARGSFGDSVTIVPDHFAARIAAVAVLGALLRRRRTGRGALIEIAQAESILGALAPEYLLESVVPGTMGPSDRGRQDAPWHVYRCAGDDEWCVITVRGDDDWRRLVDAIGSPAWATGTDLQRTAGRLAASERIDAELGRWTAERSPADVAELLQRSGVPAARMVRLSELRDDPHLADRDFFRRFRQPGYADVVLSENGPGLATGLSSPDMRPAPLHGQHTREVAAELLGLSAAETDELVSRGVLEDLSEGDAAALDAFRHPVGSPAS